MCVCSDGGWEGIAKWDGKGARDDFEERCSG